MSAAGDGLTEPHIAVNGNGMVHFVLISYIYVHLHGSKIDLELHWSMLLQILPFLI